MYRFKRHVKGTSKKLLKKSAGKQHENQISYDDIAKEHGLRSWQPECCFFAMSGGFVRMRGGDDGIYAAVRQLVFRCGMCGEPVSEAEMNKHFDKHALQMRTGVS